MSAMHLTLVLFGSHPGKTLLPLIVGLLSGAILLGCAVACWFSPSEKDDCLFHREVFWAAIPDLPASRCQI